MPIGSRSRVYVSRVECPSPGAASGGEEKKRKRKREAGLKVWPGRIYHIRVYDYIRVRSTLNPPPFPKFAKVARWRTSFAGLAVYLYTNANANDNKVRSIPDLSPCVCVFNERMGNSLHFIRHESRRCCRRTGSPTGKYI